MDTDPINSSVEAFIQYETSISNNLRFIERYFTWALIKLPDFSVVYKSFLLVKSIENVSPFLNQLTSIIEVERSSFKKHTHTFMFTFVCESNVLNFLQTFI